MKVSQAKEDAIIVTTDCSVPTFTCKVDSGTRLLSRTRKSRGGDEEEVLMQPLLLLLLTLLLGPQVCFQ